MHLHVRHTSTYQYNGPVALNPHTLYLYPRMYPYQRLIAYELIIDPVPSKVVRNVDVEGNVQQVVYFHGPTQRLSVTADMVLQSDDFNSFDFVIFPFESKKLPGFRYQAGVESLLHPYLDRTGVTAEVELWARRLAAGANWETVPFLSVLNQTIRGFAYEKREHGAPNAPEDTLQARRGSCRDYTTLFMAACRSLGLAARFVSGYLFGNPQQEHELHAWAEVYLPGAGWRGFDPTEGSVVNNRHIFLTSTARPELAAPIAGSYNGSATSVFSNELLITNDGGIAVPNPAV
ncbi:transglutaminase family protein [Rudanella paleaurantiibacter]|uniref:Transglutaminase family protein n=1 Tax=Rudanella paleaurantiibacter TaxID=2614655 RepID=A0A7J5U641_9BACT|nr:transglutaminase family protein [Rudanella paleaurantiibacter]KAB7733047.1 transglutaminase family protein [Rudanella paleaurantiibacter]